jgi:hypothetical protein
MVGLGQEAKRDVGGVTRGRFNVERERAEKELTARGRGLPFKPVEKEVGRGGPGGRVRVEEGEGGSGSTGSGRSRRLCLRRQHARVSEAGRRTGQGGGTRATRGDGALATDAQARVREAVARNRGGWCSMWTLTGGPWHQCPSFKPVETG